MLCAGPLKGLVQLQVKVKKKENRLDRHDRSGFSVAFPGDKVFHESSSPPYRFPGFPMPHDHDVDERIARVRLALRDACQDHVLSYVDAGLATPEETASLLTQIEALDLPELNRIFNGLGIEPSASVAAAAGNDEYAPLSDLASVDTTSPALLREWEEMGLDAIGRGKVAALVLSGGQGTRLGFDGPKGMYDIGLPSGKSIFQLLAERILRVSALAAERFLRSPEGKDCPNEGSTRKHIPFYVMTSPLNHEKTQDFFKENNYFGLCPADVFFFRQSTMPCFDLKGKLLLESPTSLAQAPDGNGGKFWPWAEKVLAEAVGLPSSLPSLAHTTPRDRERNSLYDAFTPA